MSPILAPIAIVPPPVTSSVFCPVPFPIVAPIVEALTMIVSLPAPRLTVSFGPPTVTTSLPEARLIVSLLAAPTIVIVAGFGFAGLKVGSALTFTVASSPARSSTIWFCAANVLPPPL